ncbi:MAG: hypothetical protein J6332_07810 [Abditibacteriota bacterium]|nr:hypothetical protein [Abditibacteriota bacterium]
MSGKELYDVIKNSPELDAMVLIDRYLSRFPVPEEVYAEEDEVFENFMKSHSDDQNPEIRDLDDVFAQRRQ